MSLTTSCMYNVNMENKRSEALKLSEELLSDIELSTIPPTAVVRKASRLARFLDDSITMEWLKHEITGYVPTKENKLDSLAWLAALKSKRVYFDSKSEQRADTRSLSQLQAEIEAGKLQYAATADASYQISSANQYQHVQAPKGNTIERNSLRQQIANNQALIDKVVGAIHEYATTKNLELRFGAAVETAFENVRKTVDSRLVNLIPGAMPILTTALENAQTNNQIQWNNAAKACRDLIKSAADTLRPAGPDVKGIKMGDDNYINRLVDWIQKNIQSTTKRELITTDLTHLGERLDAVTGSGHKGAHHNVTKDDASRFIVGTYLLLGDILSLHALSPETSEKVDDAKEIKKEEPKVRSDKQSEQRKNKPDKVKKTK